MIRTFIAIKIDSILEKDFWQLQQELKKKLTAGRPKWVEPQNMHLTINFLGEIKEELIPLIEASLQTGLKEIKPFILSFCGLGVFPNLRKPRVLWSGINEGKDSVSKIYNFTQDSLSSIGFSQTNKCYHPHLTLARFREPVPFADISSVVKETSFSSSMITVKGITLFQSILRRQGSQYIPLKEILF
ncbi:MAG: RNA 2',3'-cyclic phosphodiesterase [Firmicutes bacterium]|jgi:2'-5' RNA ligase|nr:RNA 2',3'-cyclic phosphodiesterase [Bacillota bacterium]